MAIINCKMCGGKMDHAAGASVSVCPHCGTLQTTPSLDNPSTAALFENADSLRANGEFDKAEGVYRKILAEDGTDAEAYWALVLCCYGVKYVEDPKMHSLVPTVNRAEYGPVSENGDYKAALKYADEYQRELYESEAKAIGDAQRKILALPQNAVAFDVYICCKETDINWKRTQDSVLATDLYKQLDHEGIRVFYPRVTLENKRPDEHEAYMFAALSTAKVMIVFATEKEYVLAPEVKNGWSRYLVFVKNSGGSKALIPAFKGMDSDSLPEELKVLRTQDISKPGSMQDLIRSVNKLIGYYEANPLARENSAAGSAANAETLLKRGKAFLEERNWYKADQSFELVLTQDTENVEAYLGKLMAYAHARRREDLLDCSEPFDDNENYRIIEKIGGEELAAELKGYVDSIKERNTNEKLTEIYNKALSAMNVAMTENTYLAAAEIFKKVPGFRDADELCSQCIEKAEGCRKHAIYAKAIMQMQQNGVHGFEEAIRTFQTIPGWRDVDHQISLCRRNIDEISEMIEEEKLERRKKKNSRRKKVLAITLGTAAVVAVIVVALVLVLNK